jgi:hypothetical protein
VVVPALFQPVDDRLVADGGVDKPHPVEDRDLQDHCQKDDWNDLTHGLGSLPFISPA